MLGSAFLVMSLCPVRPHWPRTSTVISKQCPTFSLSCCCWGGTSFWLLLFCSETFFPLAKQDLFFAFLLFYFLGLEMVPACPSTVIVFSFVCTGLWSSRCSPDCRLSPRVSVACFLAVHRPAHSHTVFLGPHNSVASCSLCRLALPFFLTFLVHSCSPSGLQHTMSVRSSLNTLGPLISALCF